MTTYKTIADLPPASFVTGADQLEISQGGTSRSVMVGQIVNAVFYNVRDFGALGNGITNDAPAINAAIAYVTSHGGGTVFFPAGVYLVGATGVAGSGNINVASNTMLIGSGRQATIIKLADHADSQVIACTDISNFAVENMTLDGNRLNQTTAGHGIRGAGCSNGRFVNLTIRHTLGYGIGCQDGTMSNLVFDTIRLEDSGGDAIDFKNHNDDNNGIMFNNIDVGSFSATGTDQAGIDIRGHATLSNIFVRALPASGVGVRFREGELLYANGYGGHQCSISNFHIVGAARGLTSGVGIAVSARNVAIANGVIENCTAGIVFYEARNTVTGVHGAGCGEGLIVAINAHDCSVIGCLFDGLGTTSRGIRVDAANNSRLIGNACLNHTTYGIRLNAGINTIIAFNDLTGNTTAGLTDAGTTTHIHGNLGYVTETNGTVILSAAAASVSVSHGMTGIPASILLTPRSSLGAITKYFVGTVSGTTFAIQADVVPGIDVTFGWEAKVKQ